MVKGCDFFKIEMLCQPRRLLFDRLEMKRERDSMTIEVRVVIDQDLN